jgi:hypothetical protein
MKALLLNGSHRLGGNTATALNFLKALLEEGGAEVECVNLAELRIETCVGCRLRFEKGERFCPRKDDLLAMGAEVIGRRRPKLGARIQKDALEATYGRILTQDARRLLRMAMSPPLFSRAR